ncbi:MAG: hypothetical protein ABW194_10420 [Novosphingobium sp.]
MRRILLICLMLSWPGRAHAEWLEAASDHFVVYADDSEKDIVRLSGQLERYHAAMGNLTGHQPDKPSPSNRVTVYVVKSVEQVRKLHGGGVRSLGGFYIPRAGASVAIVPRVDAARGDVKQATLILLHEYAHHFFISASGFPMPRWLSEGAAEFFATARFEDDGSVWLGLPANHRAAELALAPDVPVADLLDPEAYARRKPTSFDAFYGKSWLLYHYLTFDDRRKGQLARYVALMAEGRKSRDAAREVFGDLAKLEKDVDAYVRKPRILSFKLAAARLPIGPVAIRRLPPGEAEMMPVRTRSRRGVDEAQAKALVSEARGIAARFPREGAVLAALAEAEYDAGNDREAIAAADAALALDPAQTNAYVQKGFALFRQARDAPDPVKAYAAARAPFVALNRRENDHPLPLIFYYRSFVEQGRAPPPLALDGLAKAAQLAPFDLGLRMSLATQQLRSGNRQGARANLAPVAYDPHGGPLAAVAQRLLARLDDDPAWNGIDGLEDLMAGVGATAAGEGA